MSYTSQPSIIYESYIDAITIYESYIILGWLVSAFGCMLNICRVTIHLSVYLSIL